MLSLPFLTIDGTPVTLAAALRYLHAAGSLPSFIGEILRQHVLEREIRDRAVFAEPLLVELAIADFRAARGLADDAELGEWLALRGQELAAFRGGVERDVRLETLKQEVTEPLLAGYFEERRVFLDRVRLSRMAVGSRAEGVDLRARLAGGAAFDETEEPGGTAGEYRWLELPATLRDELRGAAPGAVVGPVELADGWELCRLDAHLLASLEDAEVRSGLREELFERWLGERLERLSVELSAEEG